MKTIANLYGLETLLSSEFRGELTVQRIPLVDRLPPHHYWEQVFLDFIYKGRLWEQRIRYTDPIGHIAFIKVEEETFLIDPLTDELSTIVNAELRPFQKDVQKFQSRLLEVLKQTKEKTGRYPYSLTFVRKKQRIILYKDNPEEFIKNPLSRLRNTGYFQQQAL